MSVFHYNSDFSLAFNIFANSLVVLGVVFIVAWTVFIIRQVVRNI